MLEKNGYFCAFLVDMLLGKCELFFYELQQILTVKNFTILELKN